MGYRYDESVYLCVLCNACPPSFLCVILRVMSYCATLGGLHHMFSSDMTLQICDNQIKFDFMIR